MIKTTSQESVLSGGGVGVDLSSLNFYGMTGFAF